MLSAGFQGTGERREGGNSHKPIRSHVKRRLPGSAGVLWFGAAGILWFDIDSVGPGFCLDSTLTCAVTLALGSAWLPRLNNIDSVGLEILSLLSLQLVWLGISGLTLDVVALPHCPVVLWAFPGLMLVLFALGVFWPVAACFFVFGYSLPWKKHRLFPIGNNRGFLGTPCSGSQPSSPIHLKIGEPLVDRQH